VPEHADLHEAPQLHAEEASRHPGDEKARAGDVRPPESGPPTPEGFVENVTKLEATSIGEGDSSNPIYRALLRVDLTNAKHAKLFRVGESFGAVADLGGDFDELFC
jgi:hypothetical protein